jgi:predicted nucleic acid-binding protein
MIAPSNTLVCDATVVLNLGHRGGLEDLTAALAQDRKLVVTTEVAREVSMDDPSFYQGFLARYFAIDSRPLLRVAAVENAAMPMRLDSGEISVLSLCLQTQWAACIDESAGRRVARTLELECFGTFGLLRHGIDQRWMTDHKALEVVRRLRSRGLFCPKVLPEDTFTRYLARLG